MAPRGALRPPSGIEREVRDAFVLRDLLVGGEPVRAEHRIARHHGHLGNILDSYLGRDVMKLWKLDWPIYDEKQICHVQVTRANKPVYVSSEGKEEFFARKEGS